MKKLSLFSLVVALMIGFVACDTPKKPKAPIAEKTIENLKAAITGESNASAKYMVFSQAAEAAGLVHIAKIFAAASEAEMIHVNNHQAVLKTLCVEAFEPVIEEHVADSDMAKNLETAIEGETYEFTEMYPEFVRIATEEKVSDAVKSFIFAMKAEQGHAKQYQVVLDIFVATNSDVTATEAWYVCPVCGELTSNIEDNPICPICGETADTFKKF